MRKLFSVFRNIPKRVAAVSLIAVAAIVPAAIFAWGPIDRATFTVEKPAHYITFNSITNNPTYGDERNFVTIKDASNTGLGGWEDEITVQPGKEYLVRMYVHNNAAENLKLVAENTRVMANVPTNTGKQIQIDGFVTANNAEPKKIWDQAILRSASDFNLAYVAGSAKFYNNVFGQTGANLSDGIVTSAGALVGYDKLDGKVPGCFEYSGYVTFKVKVQGSQTPSFEMQKTVQKLGDYQKWAKDITAQPGDKVEYRIKYKNTGEVQQDNVVVKDMLPNGITYVPGTTKLYTTSFPNGKQLTDDVTKGGVNIGSYSLNSTAYVIFTAQVGNNAQLPECGPNKLTNKATVETDHGSKDDNANVTVPKECQPEEGKITCDLLTVDKISRTQFRFTTKYTTTNATFKQVTYVVTKDGQEVDRFTSTKESDVYTISDKGNYKVKALVTGVVNGKEQTVTDAKCEKPFSVDEEPVKPVYICEKLTAIRKDGTRDEYSFNLTVKTGGNVTVRDIVIDFGDNQSATRTLETLPVSHKYGQPGSYVATAKVNFMVDGKLVKDVTGNGCKVEITVEQPPVVPPQNPHNPQPQKPGVPTELPATGPEMVIGGIIGSSALGLGVHSYFASRRALRDALHR
ncbi:MAG TPA: hypothetical protein VD907_01330 [Verrucomicrobiae bacterium]|nr:hypothetical protein [Verrucomicrobiae bacterium]